MDLIWEKFTEWLKEVLVSGIMDNVNGMFDNVNSKVAEIAGQVGATPQGWNGGMLSFEKKLRWVKLTLIPYAISGSEPTHVFGSFINVSEEHAEFENNAELLANMPGGFHLCYLSDPIHVEWSAERSCVETITGSGGENERTLAEGFYYSRQDD